MPFCAQCLKDDVPLRQRYLPHNNAKAWLCEKHLKCGTLRPDPKACARYEKARTIIDKFHEEEDALVCSGLLKLKRQLAPGEVIQEARTSCVNPNVTACSRLYNKTTLQRGLSDLFHNR